MDVGVVGPGDRITHRLSQWHLIEDVSVSGFVTTDSVVPETDIPIYEDIEALVDAGLAVDCVSTPTTTRSLAISAITAGAATLLPWPPAESVADAEAIASAANATDSPVVAGLLPQFDPPRRRAKERIGDGAVGDVGNVRLSRRLTSDDDIVPTVALELDFFRWVCGDLDRVFARRSNTIDAVVATGRFVDGTVFHVDVCRDDQRDTVEFEFAGDDGLIEYDSREAAGVTSSRGPAPSGETAPAHRLLAHFRDCVRNEATPAVEVTEAVEILRVADAIVQSITRGVPITGSELSKC